MVEREEKNIKNRKIKIKQNKKAKSIKQINKLIKKRKNNSLEKREGKKKNCSLCRSLKDEVLWFVNCLNCISSFLKVTITVYFSHANL